MRTEKDFIGSVELPANVLFGIHAYRAMNNFPDTTSFQEEWYRALATVKKACYITAQEFQKQVKEKYKGQDLPLVLTDEAVFESLVKSAEELESGMHFENFIVPAVSGGAGTSINMNVNEIIANRALQLMGRKAGDHTFIDPVEHANIYQSTNDVIPTSLKVAVIRLLTDLEKSINELRSLVESKEKEYRNTLRIAYTQMQEAVPSSYGRLFASYCDALSRDWWRVSKCFERIKTVNLGGSAVGTGITVPRFFIMEVVQNLQKISGLPVARAENMCDATQNLDAFVEVHGILKAHAVNLEKIANDIRLLSSDAAGSKEISIPQVQVGSSVMPAKVNPVIAEFVISAAHKVYANDSLVTSLAAQGCLDLNAYLPVIGHCIIESLKLLVAADATFGANLFAGLTVNAQIAADRLMSSPAITTALLPSIGYKKATALALEMKEKHLDIISANEKLKLMDPAKLKATLEPQNLLKEGFSVNDII